MLQKCGFKRKSYEDVVANAVLKQAERLETLKKAPKRTTKPLGRKKMLKRERLVSRTEKARKELVLVSHTYVRERDSDNPPIIRGKCFDCGIYCGGKHFQAGHFTNDSAGGALLRYHPRNMHGQFSGCNMKQRQEFVKINYTLKMEDTYGRAYVDKLRALRNHPPIKADIIFYETMLDLYKKGDEQSICDFLENY